MNIPVELLKGSEEIAGFLDREKIQDSSLKRWLNEEWQNLREENEQLEGEIREALKMFIHLSSEIKS